MSRVSLLVGTLFLVAIAAAPAGADPRDEINSAIQKTSKLDNYTWVINDDANFDMRPEQFFLPERPSPIVVQLQPGDFGYLFWLGGAVQNDGLASMTVETGWRKTHQFVRAFMKHGRMVLDAGDGWKSDSQIQMPADDQFSQQDVAPIAVLVSRYFHYANAASFLLDKTVNLRNPPWGESGGNAATYVGDLADAVSKRFVPPPQYKIYGRDLYFPVRDDKATASYVIERGILVQFRVEVKADGGVFFRSLTASLSNIGSTSIALPDSAVAPLNRTDKPKPPPRLGVVVGLDEYYNHQMWNGRQFAYTWEDAGSLGFSKFGEIWKSEGASLASLHESPTRPDLDHFSIYIIASPSNEQNAGDHRPNYIEPPAIDAIASWVQDGGTLVLLGNSNGNCELHHLNALAGRFGIGFNADSSSTVPKPANTTVDWHDEKVATFPEKVDFWPMPMEHRGFPHHVLFKDVKMIYIKDYCTLKVQNPYETLLMVEHAWRFEEPIRPPPGFAWQVSASMIIRGTGKLDSVMAISHFGKGFVFAVGSPWLFNRSLSATLAGQPNDNPKAAENLVGWLYTISFPPRATN